MGGTLKNTPNHFPISPTSTVQGSGFLNLDAISCGNHKNGFGFARYAPFAAKLRCLVRKPAELTK